MQEHCKRKIPKYISGKFSKRANLRMLSLKEHLTQAMKISI